MKKLRNFTGVLSLAILLVSCTSTPKSNTVSGNQLDPKTKFAIEGVELGTIDWAKEKASINNKGEIIWNNSFDDNWLHIGWELRGVDLSKYAGLRVELASAQDLTLEIADSPVSFGRWNYKFTNGVCYAFFNGAGRIEGDMKNPDLEEGFSLRFMAEKGKYQKTVIKNITLLLKEDVPDVSNLELEGCSFGSNQWQAIGYGNEITWQKGTTSGDYGWNLAGVDLSEYDRVRVEIESNTAKNLGLRLCDPNHENWHGFNNPVEPNVFEADLTGEGASWTWENAVPLDKSKGLKIFLQTWNDDKPFTSDYKTVVKSVQLLKGKKIVNEHLALNGALFGSSSWNNISYEGGIVEWQWDGKDKYPSTGWNVKDVDLSAYKKLRVEIESTDIPLDIRLIQRDGGECHIGYETIKPNLIEVNLDGSDCSWSWPESAKWNPSSKIEEIHIRACGVSKKGLKTVIKSVTLLSDDDSKPQPETLVLNGAKIGSIRDKAWIDDDFAINWQKGSYVACGWRVEKLEGEILEIRVTSSDVPLRLRIRESANKNEASWIDDGSHIFRIDLGTLKQITGKKGDVLKAPEWVKYTKAFDLSQGCEIVLEAPNGVFKEGKKTVVESVKILSWEDTLSWSAE